MPCELHLKAAKKQHRLLDFTSIVSELVGGKSHMINSLWSEFLGVASDAGLGDCSLRTTAVETYSLGCMFTGELEKICIPQN